MTPTLDAAVIVALAPFEWAQTAVGEPSDQSVLTEVFQFFVGRTLVEVIKLEWEVDRQQVRKGWRVDLSPMEEYVMDVRSAFEAEPLRSYFFDKEATARWMVGVLVAEADFDI